MPGSIGCESDPSGGLLLREIPPEEPETATVVLPVTEQPGDQFGRYKLREKIGEGGCGRVCVAEQEERVVQQGISPCKHRQHIDSKNAGRQSKTSRR